MCGIINCFKLILVDFERSFYMESVNPNLGENKDKAYQLDSEYMTYILYPENNGYRTMLSFRKEGGDCDTAIIKIRGGSYNVSLVIGDTITYNDEGSLSCKETPELK